MITFHRLQKTLRPKDMSEVTGLLQRPWTPIFMKRPEYTDESILTRIHSSEYSPLTAFCETLLPATMTNMLIDARFPCQSVTNLSELIPLLKFENLEIGVREVKIVHSVASIILARSTPRTRKVTSPKLTSICQRKFQLAAPIRKIKRFSVLPPARVLP